AAGTSKLVPSFRTSPFHLPGAGGFAAHPGHDAHIHPTLSAIQILVMYDALDRLDAHLVVKFILSLHQPSGVFAGDYFGETDTRFSYIAVNASSLLGCLDQLDNDKTVDYIKQCRNLDGGFGNSVGAESHAAQEYVPVPTGGGSAIFPNAARHVILGQGVPAGEILYTGYKNISVEVGKGRVQFLLARVINAFDMERPVCFSTLPEVDPLLRQNPFARKIPDNSRKHEGKVFEQRNIFIKQYQ
ncbi:terpenoid cyclases/protein prenyltransferase alpha-alpha toroid, partial [Mycena olivaceomarginata]